MEQDHQFQSTRTRCQVTDDVVTSPRCLRSRVDGLLAGDTSKTPYVSSGGNALFVVPDAHRCSAIVVESYVLPELCRTTECAVCSAEYHAPKLCQDAECTMYGHTYSKSIDKPGKVACPARGQLNRKNECFPVRVRARGYGLARWVRQSRPASACSSPYSAESGAYLRDSSRVPRRRPFIHL